VNVINKPGGKAIPGSYEVFQAAPNGYTMFNDSAGTSEFLVVAEKNLPFDIMQRTYIGTHSAVSYLLAVPSTSPYNTLQDLIREAKTNPQNIKYASLAGTTSIELAIRQFFAAIGADISKTKAVMVDGGAGVVTLTAGGHVSLGSAGTSGWLPSAKAGTVRLLFITSKERNPLLPDVPTSAEVGLPTVTATNWFGISGPPKLPAHVVEAWDLALKDMVKDPDVAAQFRNIGAVPFHLGAQDLRKFIAENLEDLKKFWK
jgi:tripartite-type tricarboxylate transporter receptor subunit TctC